MALTPDFTAIGQLDPSQILITDTSTGSDGTVVDRKILITQTSGVLLGASPYDFPTSGSSITINPLTEDIAVTITLNWLNNVGGVVYTLSKIFSFNQYGLQFLEGLTQKQIANPEIVNDQNFISNKFQVFLEIQSALNAISVGSSVVAAQSCINRYNDMITNQNLYF